LAAHRRLLKLRSKSRSRKLLQLHLLLHLPPIRLHLLPLRLLLLPLAKLHLLLLRLRNKFSNKDFAPKETEATLSPFFLFIFSAFRKSPPPSGKIDSRLRLI
jgi:hypothetical protein